MPQPRLATSAACALALSAAPALAQPRQPVIDMHLHAHALADYGGGMPGCGNQGALEFPPVDPRDGIGFQSRLVTCPPSSVIPPAASDEALLRETLAMLERHDIVLALTTGTVERVSRWRAASDRIVPATYFDVGGAVVIEGMTEEKLRPTLESPLAMIVSDGVLEDGAAHPRLAGSYARVLGRYVREQRVLGLMDALRKMTLMPAQRLEARAPAMRNKGRLRVGADADVTIFDPATVIDRATYAEPLLPSVGIAHVLVAGVPVVRDGRFVDGAVPGRAVRGAIVTLPAGGR